MTFVAVESAYIMNIKVSFILLLPIPTDYQDQNWLCGEGNRTNYP